MSFDKFEHQLLKTLKEQLKENFEKGSFDQDVFIGCSGGADSVALFLAFNKIAPVLKVKPTLVHIHHGTGDDEVQNKFRDKALEFCKKLSKEQNCEFVLKKAEENLVSEEDCRDFRLAAFMNFKPIFLGQHKDDLFETQLLRLIRGTGLQGLKNPFSNLDIKRPFLELFSKAEILDYLKEQKQDYLEDPSNAKDGYLRNWLRGTWLPELEKKRGISGLRESLKLISEETKSLDKSYLDEISFGIGNEKMGLFKYAFWLSLDKVQKQSVIAHILLKTKQKGYTKGQVNEVIKHLDLQRKTLRFKSGGLVWEKDQGRVSFRHI